MDRKAFLQALKSGKAGGVYLFEGPEENIKAATLKEVRRHLLPEGLEELNETILEAPETSAIIAAAETLPFAAEKRLVVVREHPALAGRAEADPKLLDYLARSPESCVLLFYQKGKADARKKLYTAIKKRDGVVSFPLLNSAEAEDWIVRTFSASGKRCEGQVAALLAFTVGLDTALLHTEIDKLIALIGDRSEVTAEDVRAVATRSVECTVFEMVDAVVAGQQGRAFALLRDMLTTGQDRLGILAMLLRQYRLLQHVKIMQYEKEPAAGIKQKLGVAPFAAEKCIRQAAGYTGGEVRRAVEACLRMEYMVKSGQINQEGAVEAVMLTLLALRSGRKAG